MSYLKPNFSQRDRSAILKLCIKLRNKLHIFNNAFVFHTVFWHNTKNKQAIRAHPLQESHLRHRLRDRANPSVKRKLLHFSNTETQRDYNCSERVKNPGYIHTPLYIRFDFLSCKIDIFASIELLKLQHKINLLTNL